MGFFPALFFCFKTQQVVFDLQFCRRSKIARRQNPLAF